MIDFKNPDAERFLYACDELSRQSKGIGTYNEHSMHAVLKHYIEPDSAYHELPVGRFIADICREDEICEIQTGKVYALAEKLSHFLEYAHVTLVIPQVMRRYTMKYDKTTGEALSTRISPRRGHIQDAAAALSPIWYFITNPNLSVWVPLLNVTDLRPANEPGRRREKKTDTLPKELLGGIYIESPRDMLAFLPETLPEVFTTKDVARLAPCPLPSAQTLMTMLYKLELVERERGEGNLYRYRKKL